MSESRQSNYHRSSMQPGVSRFHGATPPIASSRALALIALLALGAIASPGFAEDEKDNANWPQWRGAGGDGVAPAAKPPVRWSETENVRWKVDVAGLGTSTPVIWGDTIFLTTAIDTGKPGPRQAPVAKADAGDRPAPAGPTTIYQWVLMALDRKNGEVKWSRVAREQQPHEGTHPDGTHASNSPITDGEFVYAFFGSQGIHAYDFEGERKWEKDLGDMTTRLSFGEGASPALHGNTLVVNWDHEGESFVVALDKRDGKELWRRSRAEEATTWSTPLIVERADGAQAIISATHRVISYDLATGKTVWEASGMTLNVIPTPIEVDGVVYLASGFRGNALMAVRLDGAKGDITGTENVLWTYDRDTPYVPTPVVYDGLVYMLKSNKGLLSVIDAKSGELVYGIERLDSARNVYASALAADGKVYFVGRDGGTTVIKAGRKFEVLAENELDDRFDASPAAVGEELFLRGRKSLYCLANKQ